MRHKLLCTVMGIVAMASGCVLQGRSAPMAYAVNGGLALGGIAMMGGSPNKTCPPPSLDDPDYPGCQFDNLGNDISNGIGRGVGTVLLVAGAIGLIGTMIANAGSGAADKVPASDAQAKNGADFQAQAPGQAPGASEPATGESSCVALIRHWHAASAQASRDAVYRKMSPACRVQLVKDDAVILAPATR